VVTNKSNTNGKFVVNTAILLAKSVGSSKLKIAVKGGVVVLTVGIVKVIGALAILKLGSIKIGRGVTPGSTGKPGYRT
jgi:hypothetical protein